MILACDGCGVLYLDNYKSEGDPCPLNLMVKATWPGPLGLCDGHLVPCSASGNSERVGGAPAKEG